MVYNKKNQVSAIKPNNNSLGFYYLDLTETITDYTSETYGEFDSSGIPKMGKGSSSYYNEVVIMNYGFILHTEILKNKNKLRNIEILKKILICLDGRKKELDDCSFWPSEKEYKRYGLLPGFCSAITQGYAISFYLRMYELFGKEEYLETAKKAYNYLKLGKDEGGVRVIDSDGYLWFEEYPSSEPSFVLNGFIYAIFGIYDAYKLNIDPKAEKDYLDALKTLKENIHKYDAGYWSYYCLLLKELVMVYYQKNVHVPQMMAMYYISGEDTFKFYAKKWNKQINLLNILFVKIMYRVRYRLKFIMK